MQGTLGSITARHELVTVVLVCNLSMQEVETGGSGVKEHLLLHMGFETSGGYTGSCLLKSNITMD